MADSEIQTERITLGETIASRDSTLVKDSLAYNYFPEKEADGKVYMVRRFGLDQYRSLTAGAAKGMFSFGGVDVSVIGTTCYLGATSLGTVNGTGGPYQFITVNYGAGFFMKNTTNAYHYNGTTLSAITDANYPALTVWGVGYLDGYVFVVDPSGSIWNSNTGDCTTWPATYIAANASADPAVAIASYLNYIVVFLTNTTQFFYDAGNATGSPLLPQLNATANVGCVVGSSISASDNTLVWIGQTRQFGRSVYILNSGVPQPISDQYVDRILNTASLTGVSSFFIKIVGHAFYVLTVQGLNITLVLDMLTQKWHLWSSTAYNSAYTSPTMIVTNSNNVLTATAIVNNHGLQNGDVILVNGGGIDISLLGVIVPNVVDTNTLQWTAQNVAIDSALIGVSPIQFINSTSGLINFVSNGGQQINFYPNASPFITPTGSLSIQSCSNNFFTALYYASTANGDLLLDQSSGVIYKIDENAVNDNGVFIYGNIRTPAIDFGNNKTKFYNLMEVVADKVPEVAFLGYTNDDYQSYKYFRPILLNSYRSQLRRGAQARRRAWSIVYLGYSSARFYQLELTFTQAE